MNDKERFSQYCDNMIATGGLTESTLDILFWSAQAEVLWRIDEVVRDIKAKELAKDYIRIQRETGMVLVREGLPGQFPLRPTYCHHFDFFG